jgi:hypothetical protein
MGFHLLQNQGANTTISVLSNAVQGLSLRHERSHCLLILTCYVRPEALIQLIEAVAQQVKLTYCLVLFDYSEHSTVGHSKLQEGFLKAQEKLVANYPGFSLSWEAVRSPQGTLLHTKGYAVLQINKKRIITGGIVLSGSSNATARGLGLAAASNIEIGYVTRELSDLNKFNKIFIELQKFASSAEEDVTDDQEELFRYEILSRGRFLSKWSGNLRSLLSIRYDLSKEGKTLIASTDPELKKRGFKEEKSSITKAYVKVPAAAKKKAFPKFFSKNYTIETSIGRWCPSSIWEVADEEITRKNKPFFAALRKALSDRSLDLAMKKALEDFKYLQKRKVVDCSEVVLQHWRARLERLRNDSEKLGRIHQTFSTFKLPYGREAVEEVAEVFESLQQTLAYAKQKNIAMKKVEAALDEGTLQLLSLRDTEEASLRALFHPKKKKTLPPRSRR